MQKLNYSKESVNINNWIRKVFIDSVQKKVVIGLSGGIDSSVSCTLLTQSIGTEQVIPVLLPYGDLSTDGLEDAKLLIKHLQIPEKQIVIIDIKRSVDTLIQRGMDNPRRGNIMARVRMIYLFDLAKQDQGLVCGTENKSEHYLGYYTRFGDEASDFEVIRHLYKTHVWEMGKYLGLPKKIITKSPTAGLWEGQTDEGEMGFSYKNADKVLYYFFDEKLSEEEIIKKGLDHTMVKKVLQRVKDNEFKHHLPFVYQP